MHTLHNIPSVMVSNVKSLLTLVWDLVHVMAAVAPRREVFAFRTPQSFEGWAVKTDRTIGGKC